MYAKILSLSLAGAALIGAVLYAQKQAEKGGKVKPVFESSKIGTPTPWPDDKESPTSPKKKPAPPKTEGEKTKKKPEEFSATDPRESYTEEQIKSQPQKTPEDSPKKKKKKVMPTSKSYIPD